MSEPGHGIPGLHVEGRWKADGAFEISGHHLGESLVPLMGKNEYEYAITVPVEQLDAFAAALGADAASGTEGIDAAWSAQESEIVRHGEKRWLTEHGIEHEFWSW
ncbi:MAG: hypothetical protein ABIQ01_07980 [Pseudolysinimonas sp.]